MSSYQDLKSALAHIYAIGGVVEEIQLAEDIEHEIIAEMLNGADSKDVHPHERRSLQDPSEAPFLGLRYFYGYRVISKPACSGIQIVYH